MPMMRRGPLDRYSAEWVLRQASAHGAEGSIEFHTDHPATLWFAGGRAYAAEDGVNLTEGDLAARPILTEDEARDRAVSLLTEVMGADSGWYFHDPLGQHPSRGSWAWETATLLMDTRAKAHEDRSTTTWSERTVVLDDARGDRVTLGADAWAVVVRLAGSATGQQLAERLGWSIARTASALDELEAVGVLKPMSAWPSPSAAPSRADDPTGHHTGPLAPPPDVDPSSLRRRVLPLRRSTS